ncbi:flagellar biosynthesis regulator FlaF [Roseomonas sp. USHLN139]|uniref:flagellar biosynthesis regulator FlaF n=1 Tax=Roseomonas sp. USHLN139 TaxID=3081298 RepID=UPI003B027BC7
MATHGDPSLLVGAAAAGAGTAGGTATPLSARAAEAAAFADLAEELRVLRDGRHPDPAAALARAGALWRAVLLACGAEGPLPDSLRQGVARLALAMLVELGKPAPDLGLMLGIAETLQAGLTDLN